jgi:hypothetical protein
MLEINAKLPGDPPKRLITVIKQQTFVPANLMSLQIPGKEQASPVPALHEPSLLKSISHVISACGSYFIMSARSAKTLSHPALATEGRS